MKLAGKTCTSDLKQLLFTVSLLVISCTCGIESVVGQQRPHSCKAANLKVDRKVIEADIERYRRKETPTISSGYELINCIEAFPLLKKYAVDPDPEVRGLITDYVGRYSSRDRLQLLVRQIELYPLQNTAMRHAYLYSCSDIRRVNTKKLAAALTVRVRAASADVNSEEIYVLGCLTREDAQARRFLEEMRSPGFPNKLDERLRDYQLFAVNLALSDSNDPEVMRDVIAHIEVVNQRGRYDELTALLENTRKTSDSAILLRLSEFIRDKRTDAGSPNGLRLGDVAVGVFTRKLGTKVTGDKTGEGYTRHTDEELERIYQRVKLYLAKHSRVGK